LGWPEKTEDFERYYPTDVMVTGYDIIFFWVARMIFQAIEFTDETPFKDVLIHGLIRDAEGRKMSKSLGNGIDPLDIKEKYGIDTLRYFLTTNSAPGLDLRFEFEKVESSWNYINKLWNISRYAMMQLESLDELSDITEPQALPNQMILAAFEKTLKTVNEAYARYELSEAARAIYTFSWDLFASWYIEMSKPLMRHSIAAIQAETLSTMWTVLTKLLKLLHPFMPFVTEYLYLHLPFINDASIMISEWPKETPEWLNEEALSSFDLIQDLVLFVRQTRSFYQVGPKKPIDVYLETSKEKVFTENFKIIEEFIHPKLFSFNNDYTPNPEDITHVGPGYTVYIPLGSLVDIAEEIKKQEAELARIESEIKRAEGMLSNPKFVEKAPAKKVEEEKAKKADFETQKEALEKLLAQLKSNV
jgi:valyl-tRNA synthetase